MKASQNTQRTRRLMFSTIPSRLHDENHHNAIQKCQSRQKSRVQVYQTTPRHHPRMSDVRTLLKAKRQEIRINHPLASYTPNGQLRCVVCETNIKHPSAWDGHLGSKAHRTNAARLKEEERRRKELELELEEEAKHVKRKLAEDDTNGDTRSAAKKPRATTGPQSSTSNLPLDFFSDPSQAPLASFNNSDDEEETGEAATLTKSTDGGGDLPLDQEWIQFQQSVVNAPDAVATYDRATLFAEPELVSDPSEGFPIHDGVAQPVTRVDQDERRQKEQEERELIMDRLMDEERAQEEADMKVVIMKNKLVALRKRREASHSIKSNVGVV